MEETIVVNLLKRLDISKTQNLVTDYDTIIQQILTVSKTIQLSSESSTNNSDGRIDSALKETPFLTSLKEELEKIPGYKCELPEARNWFDIMINNIPINLKLTDCKTSDNAINKRAIYFSIVGSLDDYPKSSNWKMFWDRLSMAKSFGKLKLTRDPQTEYHYLVVNKKTGDILLKPIFDIKTYIPNPSNDLQIKWEHEFKNQDYKVPESDYKKKVEDLLKTIQKSLLEAINNTRSFAEAQLGDLFTPPNSPDTISDGPIDSFTTDEETKKNKPNKKKIRPRAIDESP